MPGHSPNAVRDIVVLVLSLHQWGQGSPHHRKPRYVSVILGRIHILKKSYFDKECATPPNLITQVCLHCAQPIYKHMHIHPRRMSQILIHDCRYKQTSMCKKELQLEFCIDALPRFFIWVVIAIIPTHDDSLCPLFGTQSSTCIR